MEIKVLNQEKDLLEFEVINKSQTYCNILRNALWDNQDIDYAAYKQDHPLVGNPVMLVRAKKGSPKKAIQDTLESLKKRFADLEKEFSALN
jgi:DNA-directed RNA polymerase subunit L